MKFWRHFISYKSLHLFFSVLTIYRYTLLPSVNYFHYPVNEELRRVFSDPRPHCVLYFIIIGEMNVPNVSLYVQKEVKLQRAKSYWVRCVWNGFECPTSHSPRQMCEMWVNEALTCCRIIGSVDFWAWYKRLLRYFNVFFTITL